jgi:glycosyltransferase involved in cell wall biosynthesis
MRIEHDPRLRPPRVLVISAAFPPFLSGESGHTLHLAWRLALRDLDVKLLTTDRPGVRSHYPFDVIPAMKSWSWREYDKLGSIMQEVEPDAVLLIYAGWNYHYHPMVTFAATLAQRVVPQANFVTQIECPGGAIAARHRLHTRIYSRVMRQFAPDACDYQYGTLLSASDRVIVLSDAHLDQLVMHHPAMCTKAHVVPPPPLIAVQGNADGRARRDGRAALNVGSGETLLAYNGLIAPGKGLATLLQAMARFVKTHPDVKLAIIGGVAEEQLPHHRRYAARMRVLCTGLGLDRHVIWTGAFDPHQATASRYLWAADAAVLPWDDGIHMNNSSVANAAAHDLPIITTAGESLEAMFKPGLNVQACPPRDPAAMAEAIAQVLDDPILRARLVAGTGEMRRQWYDWDRVIDRTIDALGWQSTAEATAPLSLAA